MNIIEKIKAALYMISLFYFFGINIYFCIYNFMHDHLTIFQVLKIHRGFTILECISFIYIVGYVMFGNKGEW